MEKKKRIKKASKKKILPTEGLVSNGQKENISNSSSNRSSILKIFFVMLILLVFFSSSVLIFFSENDREKIILSEAKKILLDRLKREGPSVEIYRSFAELYKNKDSDLYYYYLKQAFKVAKTNELPRDLLKQLVEISYQKNEKIETILYYLILLYRHTRPSNPEFFEILAAITEIYNRLGQTKQSEKILINLEKLYSQNLQIKYMLSNHYYITGRHIYAKEKIDYIVNNKKQPLSVGEITLYYLVYLKFYPYDKVLNRILPYALGLSYAEMNSFLIFLLERPEITVIDYKNVISKITIYRPEVRTLLEQNPYINLEIGKRFWNNSEKTLAEVYFAKALNSSGSEMKEIIQQYIYEIKTKYTETETKSTSQPILDKKKVLEQIK
ncbi:MAG: hypothetical protein RMJ51_05925 [Candidatus Calescibacterium sp.]|nr:hypothetical protein [Candidatus Calescibacterium sp.]MCX7972609.1 hypothetical protein [bacterium]MDW8195756.1 hypothetical protein [Candidatus Calescibacterium sp.]